MKSKKQYKLGVTLLKRSGGLYESKEKAEILNNQFKSVFTKPKPNISTTILPQRAGSTIQNLKITVEGFACLWSLAFLLSILFRDLCSHGI
jgi:hypothetical protein